MFASLQFQETLHRHTNLITSNSFTRLTPNLHLWTTTVSLAIVSPNMLKKFKSIKFVSLFVTPKIWIENHKNCFWLELTIYSCRTEIIKNRNIKTYKTSMPHGMNLRENSIFLELQASFNTRSINHIINPLTPKISLVILLTVCQRILILLVWRIQYQIK